MREGKRERVSGRGRVKRIYEAGKGIKVYKRWWEKII